MRVGYVLPFKQRVAGSSPARLTRFPLFSTPISDAHGCNEPSDPLPEANSVRLLSSSAMTTGFGPQIGGVVWHP